MSSDEEEEGLTFKEKTHPPTSGNVVVKREEEGEGGEMTGHFKGFSFKKKSLGANRNIKKRTSQW